MTRYRVTVDDQTYDVEVDDPRARPVTATVSGTSYTVEVDPAPAETPAPETTPAEAAPSPAESPQPDGGPPSEAGTPDAPSDTPAAASGDASPRTMNAPIPGVVAKVTARRGRTVSRGDELLTIDAMKMFNVMRSPWAGKVTAIHVKDGDQVVQGQPLVTVKPR